MEEICSSKDEGFYIHFSSFLKENSKQDLRTPMCVQVRRTPTDIKIKQKNSQSSLARLNFLPVKNISLNIDSEDQKLDHSDN